MLSNFDLSDIAQYYNIPLTFIGLKEELKSVPVQSGNYIINIANEHWMALIIEKDFSFYFDSFGAPEAKDITRFIKRSKTRHLGYNQSIIQDLKSSYCGFYCIGLLWWVKLHRNRYKNLYDCVYAYLDRFDDDTKKNDEVLRNIFRELTKSQKKPLLNILTQKLKL